MKRVGIPVLMGVLSVLGTGGAAADTGFGSLSPFPSKVLPVLVEVGSSGRIRNVMPAIDLPPSVSRMLNEDLHKMITKPAYDHGRPVSSQFVINLALETVVRDEGGYYAHFVYVSASPVPGGTWYWRSVNDRRYELVRANGYSGSSGLLSASVFPRNVAGNFVRTNAGQSASPARASGGHSGGQR